MVWQYVALFVISLVLNFVNRPKMEKPKPAGLNEISAPTAEVGREIPVLFGTKKVTGPNVVWYGDLRTTPVKKKVSGK